MTKTKRTTPATKKPKEELVDIVDKKDKVLKTVTRTEALENGLRHRYVQVLVFNKKGELWTQWRSRSRVICPRQFGASAAGSVKSGETYEQAAKRELKEEMGIAKATVHLLGHSQTNGKKPYNVANFACVSDVKNPAGWEDEADALDLMSAEEVTYLLERFPYLFSDGLTAALEQLDEADL